MFSQLIIYIFMSHNYYLHIYMFTHLTQSGYSVESASLIPSRLPQSKGALTLGHLAVAVGRFHT